MTKMLLFWISTTTVFTFNQKYNEFFVSVLRKYKLLFHVCRAPFLFIPYKQEGGLTFFHIFLYIYFIIHVYFTNLSILSILMR